MVILDWKKLKQQQDLELGGRGVDMPLPINKKTPIVQESPSGKMLDWKKLKQMQDAELEAKTPKQPSLMDRATGLIGGLFPQKDERANRLVQKQVKAGETFRPSPGAPGVSIVVPQNYQQNYGKKDQATIGPAKPEQPLSVIDQRREDYINRQIAQDVYNKAVERQLTTVIDQYSTQKPSPVLKGLQYGIRRYGMYAPGILALGPAAIPSAVAFEAFLSAKSAAVSHLKDNKVSYGELRQFSEFLPEGPAKNVSSILEMIADGFIAGGGMKLASKGLVSETLDTIVAKAQKAGYKADLDPALRAQIVKEAAKGTSFDKAVSDYAKAQALKIAPIKTAVEPIAPKMLQEGPSVPVVEPKPATAPVPSPELKPVVAQARPVISEPAVKQPVVPPVKNELSVEVINKMDDMINRIVDPKTTSDAMYAQRDQIKEAIRVKVVNNILTKWDKKQPLENFISKQIRGYALNEIKDLTGKRTKSKQAPASLEGLQEKESIAPKLMQGEYIFDLKRIQDTYGLKQDAIQKVRELFRNEKTFDINKFSDADIQGALAWAATQDLGTLGETYFGGLIPNLPELVKKIPYFVELNKIAKKAMTRGTGVAVIDNATSQRVGEILGRMWEANTALAQPLEKVLKNHSAETRYQVTRALSGEIPIESLPTDLQQLTTQSREFMDNISKIFMEHGALSEAMKSTIQENLGKHITRRYKIFDVEKWVPSQEVKDRAIARFIADNPGLSKEEAAATIESVVIGYKNKKKFFGSSRSPMANAGMLKMRKDLPIEYQELYGRYDDPVALLVQTAMKNSVAAANAKMFDVLSKTGLFTDKPTEINTYDINQLIPGQSGKLGNLKNKYTSKEVYEALGEALAVKNSGWVDSAAVVANKWLSWYKFTKTVGSIPTHFRNFMANPLFAMAHGTSLWNPKNWQYYKRSADILRNPTKYKNIYKQLIEDGIIGADYKAELQEVFDQYIKNDPVTAWQKIREAIINKPLDLATNIYSNEDTIYKVAGYLKDMGAGMSRQQAAYRIDRYFPNYAKASPAEKVLRGPIGTMAIGPFASFQTNTIRIVKNMLQDTIQQRSLPPGKAGAAAGLTTVLAIPAIIRLGLFLGLGKTIVDVWNTANKTKEVKKAVDVLNQAFNRQDNIMYWPEVNKLKAFDMSFMYPTGNLEKVVASLASGDLEAAFRGLSVGQSPLLQETTMLATGTDPYTGQVIAKKSDTPAEQLVQKGISSFRRNLLPLSSPIPAIPGVEVPWKTFVERKGMVSGALTGQQFKNIYDAFGDIPGDKFGRVRNPIEELKNLTGLRTYDVQPKKLIYYKKLEIKNKLREIRSEFKKTSGQPDYVVQREDLKRQTRIKNLEEQYQKIEWAEKILQGYI